MGSCIVQIPFANFTFMFRKMEDNFLKFPIVSLIDYNLLTFYDFSVVFHNN